MENNEKVVIADFVSPVEINNADEAKLKVNETREKFLEVHNKVMKKNKIASGIFFAITIAIVLIGYFVPDLMGLCFGLICAGLAFIWIFTRRQRKELDAAVSSYLYGYSLYCNSYMYDKEDVTDLEIGYKQRPDVEVVNKLSISDEVTVINSRDLVKGKMYGLDFQAADCSLKTGNPKKESMQKALFVGKIYMLDYSFVGEGRTFMYLKGCGDATPTKLGDVNKIGVPGLKKDWEIYTSHKGYERIFTSDFVKALNKIECNDTVNDVVISIVEDKVLIGFSYCDEAMIIPMNRDFETKHLEVKKVNYNQFKAINKALIDNTNFKK